MAKDGDETLIASVTSHYATARRLFTRSSSFLADATFAIRQGTPDQTIAALSEKCALSDADRQKLADLCARKGGAGFLAEKVADMNREAFHRSAFALNALVQLLCVDLGAQFSVSLPQLKFLLVFMNLFLAMVAHYARRKRLRELIAGPSRLPSRRRCFGMLPNKAYNKAVKRSSRPFAQAAWRENSVYKPAYYLNAATLFFGSEFILPPSKLVFPFGFVLGKIVGLFTTLAMAFDIWRGVRASEDSRRAREREVAVYRDLDI